eukprot:9601848-Lingulodinium_polyedra.AAC.1
MVATPHREAGRATSTATGNAHNPQRDGIARPLVSPPPARSAAAGRGQLQTTCRLPRSPGCIANVDKPPLAPPSPIRLSGG